MIIPHRVMSAVLLIQAAVLAQTNWHRIPSIDYAVGGVSNVFHVRFEGDGQQPARVQVLEFLPPVGEDAVVDDVFLPGAIPGQPCPIGNHHWLVGSTTCGTSSSARQGWISHLSLQVSGSSCIGVQLHSSVACGNFDPYQLAYDEQQQVLWMTDAANYKIRATSFGAGGGLPSLASWSEVAGLSDFGDRRTLLTAIPQRRPNGTTEWWSPWRMNFLLECTQGSAGAWSVSAGVAPGKLATVVGLPGINTLQSLSMTTTPSESWLLTHPEVGVLATGTSSGAGVANIPPVSAARGQEGSVATLEVGDRSLAVPVFGACGRSVGTSGLDLGDLHCASGWTGSRMIASLTMSMGSSVIPAWLLVGWRDPATGHEPLIWQGDVALIDVGSSAAVAIPVAVSEAGLLGDLCAGVLDVPNDHDLRGSCLVLQYVFQVGSVYCVSNVAAGSIRGKSSLPMPSNAQIAAANAAWRAPLAAQQPSMPVAAILQSLQGR